jgi:hypothetical protein
VYTDVVSTGIRAFRGVQAKCVSPKVLYPKRPRTRYCSDHCYLFLKTILLIFQMITSLSKAAPTPVPVSDGAESHRLTVSETCVLVP